MLRARLGVAGAVAAHTHLRLRVGASCWAGVCAAGVQVPICRADPVKGALVNVVGTLNVFEAAKAVGGVKKVVCASSAAACGLQSDYGYVCVCTLEVGVRLAGGGGGVTRMRTAHARDGGGGLNV